MTEREEIEGEREAFRAQVSNAVFGIEGEVISFQTTGGTAVDAPIINFAIIKASRA